MDSSFNHLNISQDILGNLSDTIYDTSVALSLSAVYEDILKAKIIVATLYTLFVGLFTPLTALAAYVLFSKGIGRRTTVIMLLAIVLMWISTMVYWTATLMAAVACFDDVNAMTRQVNKQVDIMQGCLTACLSSGCGDAQDSCPQLSEGLPMDPFPTNDNDKLDSTMHSNGCIGTVTLTVNVVIGDMIVLWRAWVLWPGNRVVRLVCAVMLLLTAVMGIMDTSDACRRTLVYDTDDKVYMNNLNIETTGTMFNEDVWGVAAGLSSLLTNVFATTLIAYRAWEHRRTIMLHLTARGSTRRTQVERTLALLVESGLMYCALWAFIVAYQLIVMLTSDSLTMSNFERHFYYVMEGCVIPLIGMYPTLVLIVCAVSKSLHDMSSDKDGGQKAASIMFVGVPPSRPRGTLSELLSAASVAEADVPVAAPSSADPTDPQAA